VAIATWSKTRRGRVVYDRPKHIFSQRDVDRILRQIAKQPEALDLLRDVLETLEIQMLEQILAPAGLEDRAKEMRKLIEDFVGTLVRGTAGILGLKISYQLADYPDVSVIV